MKANVKHDIADFIKKAIFIAFAFIFSGAVSVQTGIRSASAAETYISKTTTSVTEPKMKYYANESAEDVLKQLQHDITVFKYTHLSNGTVFLSETIPGTSLTFTGIPEKLTEGENEVNVIVDGENYPLTILAVKAPPYYIYAVYTGDPIIENKPITKGNIDVTLVDKNGLTHKVTDFIYTPKHTDRISGSNNKYTDSDGESYDLYTYTTVKVTYEELDSFDTTHTLRHSVSTEIYVPTIPTKVKKLTVKYNGPVMERGTHISYDNIYVVATYTNGIANVITKDKFTVSSTLVPDIGENKYTVVYRYNGHDYKAGFTVKGVAGVITSTYGAIQATVSRGQYATGISFVTKNKEIREDFYPDVRVPEKAESKKLLQAVNRVNKTDKYIGMFLELNGYQFDKNDTCEVWFSIPDGWDIAKTAVFYSPDIGRTKTKERLAQQPEYIYLDDNGNYFLRTYIYRAGWYALIEKNEASVTENTLRDDDETPENPVLIAYNIPSVMHVKDIVRAKTVLLYSDEELEYTYISADPSIILVEDDPKKNILGKLKAVKEGTTDVTVISNDGRFSYTTTVTVEKAVKKKTTK